MQRQRILIKSSDRTSASSSSSDFRIELPKPIQGDYIVRYIQCPNALYNVVAGSNDTVYNSIANATLTPGYYSTSTFATMLQARLRAAEGNNNFQATVDPDTKKVTITNTGAFTLNFATTTASAAKLLGFTNANTASATSQTGTNTINLIWASSIIIEVKECSYAIDSTDDASAYRGHLVVPFTVAYGSLERISHNDLYQALTFAKPVKTITVKMYDNEANSVSLNGAEWEMLIQEM